jgi:hypothetical protein
MNSRSIALMSSIILLGGWQTCLHAEGEKELVGVWERQISRPKLTEIWSVTRDLAGEFTVKLRYVLENKEVASYKSATCKWDAKSKYLDAGLQRVSGNTATWQSQLNARLRIQRSQLSYTTSLRGPLRSGRLKMVTDPGKSLLGEWVAQDANHSYTELWSISRDKESKWKINIRYLDGDKEVALAHGDTFKLTGDVLAFKTVFDRVPSRTWTDNRTTIRVTGKKVRQTWVAGKHSGKTTLARILDK